MIDVVGNAYSYFLIAGIIGAKPALNNFFGQNRLKDICVERIIISIPAVPVP
jgi:hypothetical protein